jgi:pimeloyl-ACP methyl ester carboxylesterase
MPVIRWLRGPLSVLAIRDDFSPSHTLPKVKRAPVLMVSGTGDRVFPPGQVSDLARLGGGNVESWVLPGVGHIEALAALGETYHERVAGFLRAAAEHE